MTFKQAFDLMKAGFKIKLPSWEGYWIYNTETDSIYMHCKDGKILEIRETDDLSFTLSNILSDEWIVANEKNTPILGGTNTFSFGEAIKHLKRGYKVKRKGWNGKEQYIELADDIEYCTFDGDCIKAINDDIGGVAIAFVGTRGIQMGWLASQADMLAEDWTFAE